jgi:anti-anti-sigma regulatory factor
VNGNLDFAMEISEREILLEFKGVLNAERLSAVKSELFSSVDGADKIYFVDIEQAKFRDKNYLDLFLDFLNFIKGKNSELVFIFHNEECKEFFSRFFHVFKIYDSRDSYRKDSGFWEKLKLTGIAYQRSTGLRLAPGVAIVFFILLAGWLLTLFSIISSQDMDIREREAKLSELQNSYMRSSKALEELKASVAPLKSMGFGIDTSGVLPLGAASDWQEFLDTPRPSGAPEGKKGE